jgi:quercetin dioxygenase-like cupin family protein
MSRRIARALLYIKNQQEKTYRLLEFGRQTRSDCFLIFNLPGGSMKLLDLNTTREFTEGAMKRFFLVEDSEFFKIINFNLRAGVTFPVHSHDLDGELSIQVIEGEGFFLGDNGAQFPAKTGNILISEIREPHGVRATTDMRIVVTIAPPI